MYSKVKGKYFKLEMKYDSGGWEQVGKVIFKNESFKVLGNVDVRLKCPCGSFPFVVKNTSNDYLIICGRCYKSGENKPDVKSAIKSFITKNNVEGFAVCI